jgi:hypothetical protein
MFADAATGPIQFLQRTLSAYAQGVASLASAMTGAGAGLPDPATLQRSFAAGYQNLFTAAAPFPAFDHRVTGAASPAEDFARYQSAAARWAAVMAVIAADAGRRLVAALSQAGPDTPPITRLAELQALWIDCGEAAWREAAGGDEFATAQGELLMALAELGAPPA